MFAVGEETVLGRDETADIVLTDTSDELSRRHARIVLRDEDVIVEDLDSPNGTFVNGQRVDGAAGCRRATRSRSAARRSSSRARSRRAVTRARPIADPRRAR